jgi:hypothetical protein
MRMRVFEVRDHVNGGSHRTSRGSGEQQCFLSLLKQRGTSSRHATRAYRCFP